MKFDLDEKLARDFVNNWKTSSQWIGAGDLARAMDRQLPPPPPIVGRTYKWSDKWSRRVVAVEEGIVFYLRLSEGKKPEGDLQTFEYWNRMNPVEVPNAK